ncbi:MAG TPA: ferredoxin [candidate division WOR-3 bacterium]|uniref:Ferredoxin n=1 Tax=candidate division WOR-3 bacterium TaxID=2052148 RepID=A0A7V0T4R3_UNCW3|nr:ferredoxin [candidate division WOR-3 bacterium]
MKLSVDKELCTGCELCVSSFPDLFEMDGDVAKAKVDLVAEGAEDDARQAVEDCPVEAIKLEE